MTVGGSRGDSRRTQERAARTRPLAGSSTSCVLAAPLPSAIIPTRAFVLYTLPPCQAHLRIVHRLAGVPLQPREVDALHQRVGRQPLRDAHRVGRLPRSQRGGGRH